MTRVLIHALGASMGGAVRHLTNLLPELGRHDPRTQYHVLVRQSLPELSLTSNIKLERVPDHRAAGLAPRLRYDLIDLPRRLRQGHYDVAVSLTNAGPIWSPVRHIFFQRNSLFYCRHYLSRVKGKDKIITLLRRRLAVESMKRADLIVTPSESMTQMIRDCCPQLRQRPFKTLYHGFSRDSLHATEIGPVPALRERPELRLLYPTHPANHKGFDVLFRMLATLKRQRSDFTLYTTIAREDWPAGVDQYRRQIKALGIGEQVVFTGRVAQQKMRALYEQCDLMVYPSLCESFGFSLVEAMGHGLPVVAADTPVNREICADAAVYYQPLDPTAGALAIQKALTPTVAAQLMAAAHQRVASFDWGWQRYAREFAEMIGGTAC